MRIPVFARGTNPRIDRPILRKSETYTDAQVAAGRADYVDPADKSKGIICREMLYFGERPVRVETVPVGYLAPRELPGVKFVPPTTSTWPTLSGMAQGWDWAFEGMDPVIEQVSA